MQNEPSSVLLNFLLMDDQKAAEVYLTASMRDITRHLHRITDAYSDIDWPLIIATLELYAASIYGLLSAQGKELTDALRRRAKTVIIDTDAIRQAADGQKGGQ